MKLLVMIAFLLLGGCVHKNKQVNMSNRVQNEDESIPTSGCVHNNSETKGYDNVRHENELIPNKDKTPIFENSKEEMKGPLSHLNIKCLKKNFGRTKITGTFIGYSEWDHQDTMYSIMNCTKQSAAFFQVSEPQIFRNRKIGLISCGSSKDIWPDKKINKSVTITIREVPGLPDFCTVQGGLSSNPIGYNRELIEEINWVDKD